MGFLQRRRDRKFEQQFGTEAYQVYKAATAKYERAMAETKARTKRQSDELTDRVREVEASGLEVYFRAVLSLSLLAGSTVFVALLEQLKVSGDFDPSREAEEFLDGLNDDDLWRPAWGLATWAHVGQFVAASWPERYDEAMDLAVVGLGEPTDDEQRIIRLARYSTGEDAVRFHITLLSCLVTTALGRPSEDHMGDLLRPWAAAWATSCEVFRAQLDRYFPDGPPISYFPDGRAD